MTAQEALAITHERAMQDEASGLTCECHEALRALAIEVFRLRKEVTRVTDEAKERCCAALPIGDGGSHTIILRKQEDAK